MLQAKYVNYLSFYLPEVCLAERQKLFFHYQRAVAVP